MCFHTACYLFASVLVLSQIGYREIVKPWIEAQKKEAELIDERSEA